MNRVQCSSCGSDQVIKNGGGRIRCKACGKSPGSELTGTSTLHDADGKPILTWVKTSVDKRQREALLHEIAEALGSALPRVKAVKAPVYTNADLASTYIVTDYHLGLLAWHEETGADWDTAIAENLLMDWFNKAIAMAPPSAKAVLALLGDLLHWDGLEAVTPASKHNLDADTRFQKLVRVVIRVLRWAIARLLEHNAEIEIKIMEGNHDPASSAWLREMLAALYEDEPRVHVDVSPDPYGCFEHGLTAVFFHHGHMKKPQKIHDVFARKFREVFGRTKHCYAHMGHMHHAHLIETNLMIVEQHRTLAAPDSYASRGGWLSGRSASVITYHKQYGEVLRYTIPPELASAA